MAKHSLGEKTIVSDGTSLLAGKWLIPLSNICLKRFEVKLTPRYDYNSLGTSYWVKELLRCVTIDFSCILRNGIASGYNVLTFIIVRRYLLPADVGDKGHTMSIIIRVNGGPTAAMGTKEATRIIWLCLKNYLAYKAQLKV